MNDEELVELEEEPDVGTKEEPEPEPTGDSIDDPIIIHNWDEFLEKCTHTYTKQDPETGKNITNIHKHFKFADADPEDRVIDFEMYYPNGVPKMITVYCASLNFNNWEIRNVTLYSENDPDRVFEFHTNNSNQNYGFQNANFTNILIKQDAHTSRRALADNYGTTHKYHWTNSSFNGVCESGCDIFSGIETRMHFCSINVNLYGNRNDLVTGKMECCNIHVNCYKVFNGASLASSVTDDKTYYYDTCYPLGKNCAITDCYVEGLLEIDEDYVVGSNNKYNKDNVIYVISCKPTSYHNIFSIECHNPKIKIYLSTTNAYSVYNKDLLPESVKDFPQKDMTSPIDVKTYSMFTNGLTTEELKNMSVVASAGIPIGSDKRW